MTVVEQPCPGAARSSIDAVSSPAPAPAFLQGYGEGGLGELDRKQVAGHDGNVALDDTRKEGATCSVKRLGREQGLDDKAGIQGERVGQRELLLLDREDAASEDGSAGPTGGGTCHA